MIIVALTGKSFRNLCQSAKSCLQSPAYKVLPIASSTYHGHPASLPGRVKRDTALKPNISRVFKANYEVYGAREVWLQLGREGFYVVRCTVARLMKDMGLQGVIP